MAYVSFDIHLHTLSHFGKLRAILHLLYYKPHIDLKEVKYFSSLMLIYVKRHSQATTVASLLIMINLDLPRLHSDILTPVNVNASAVKKFLRSSCLDQINPLLKKTLWIWLFNGTAGAIVYIQVERKLFFRIWAGLPVGIESIVSPAIDSWIYASQLFWIQKYRIARCMIVYSTIGFILFFLNIVFCDFLIYPCEHLLHLRKLNWLIVSERTFCPLICDSLTGSLKMV